MKKLIHEIHRRSLWQVLGIYLAGAWIALQVVNEIADAVGLPDWVSAGALVLLIVGAPIVIATAFIHEGLTTKASEEARESLGDVRDATPPPTTEATGVRKVLTWRRALVAGAGAFALLGLGTAGWMVLRSLGIGAAGSLVAKGAIEERATVLISEFEAEDEGLRGAATQALWVDLSQSNVIRLMQPREVASALERMGRDPGETVTAEVAGEIAEREGLGAIVTGDINRAGVGYVFAASVVSGADGSVLTTQRESAADSTEVIEAIDRLSRKLRERIGESFGSIRSSPPLERVTTASLEALKLYSTGSDQPQDQRIALLERALELDPEFAMAWRSLAIIFRNRNTERARMVEAFSAAFASRERLTERERRLLAADYYTLVEMQPERAIPEYEALIALDPADVSATINLGVLYSELGDFEESTRWALRGIEVDPESFTGYWNSVTSLVNLGRLEEASAILDSVSVRFGPDRALYASTMVSQARGDLEGAEASFAQYLEWGAQGGFRADLAGNLAALRAAQGRLAESDRELGVALDIREETGASAEYLETAVQAAWTDLTVRDDPDAARADLEAALERHPLEDMAVLDRPYATLAEVFARAGDPVRAGRLLDEMEREVDRALLRTGASGIDRARAEIALAEGRHEEAIELYRRADRGFCKICSLQGLSIAYERAGQADSAGAVLLRYAEAPYSDRFLAYTYPRGAALTPSFERLARLADEAGTLADAARYYARFVELWSEADPELQPRVRAAQTRLDAILAEIG